MTPREQIAASEDWKADCLRWRGKVLTGRQAHWCPDWDFLPVDETTLEINGCNCWPRRLAAGHDGRVR